MHVRAWVPNGYDPNEPIPHVGVRIRALTASTRARLQHRLPLGGCLSRPIAEALCPARSCGRQVSSVVRATNDDTVSFSRGRACVRRLAQHQRLQHDHDAYVSNHSEAGVHRRASATRTTLGPFRSGRGGSERSLRGCSRRSCAGHPRNRPATSHQANRRRLEGSRECQGNTDPRCRHRAKALARRAVRGAISHSVIYAQKCTSSWYMLEAAQCHPCFVRRSMISRGRAPIADLTRISQLLRSSAIAQKMRSWPPSSWRGSAIGSRSCWNRSRWTWYRF